MIENLSRWGLARTASWSVGDAAVRTPAIAYLEHESIIVPEEATVLSATNDEGTILRTKEGVSLLRLPSRFWMPRSFKVGDTSDDACGLVPPSVVSSEGMTLTRGGEEAVVLENAFELRRDPRAFVKAIADLRRKVGPRPLMVAPGIMDASNVAILAYAGVDVFDSSLLVYQGLRGLLSTTEGWVPYASADWLPGITPEETASKNCSVASRELALVGHMISSGRIRELAEVRSTATSWGVAVLRLLDLEEGELQERFVPMTGPRFYANSRQSLSRPDVLRYRRRVLERYRSPEYKRVLLLIPCSAKKPYYTSRSHRAFRAVLAGIPNHEVVQEMIVTSPLGVVPRELELFYPAAQYDIPVTGHWDREEVAMVQEMVRHVARGFGSVITDLGGESGFVREVADAVEVSDGRPTSSASLDALAERLAAECERHPSIPAGKDRAASLASVARFQFGDGGEALVEGCSVSGMYPVSKILDRGKQLGMLSEERGMISLTMEGGERVLSTGRHWVETEDFELKGNLFCKGVRDVDPGLRAGEEALVIRNGELVAVGVAAVCAADMQSSDRGLAVTVRHKRRQ